MAYTQQTVKIGSLSAASDLSTKQYHFVKLASATTVDIVSASTDKPIGVLLNKPGSGEAAEIALFGIVKVKAHGSLNVADVIGTTSAGKAEGGIGATQFVCGQAIETSSANDIVTVFLNISNCLNT